jgi:hypothetical protein
VARFKKTNDISIQGKFIHINRDFCAFYAMKWCEFCRSCPNQKEECMEDCYVINFIEYVEKKWQMCEHLKSPSPRKRCTLARKQNQST